ncbi:hypothetical protein CEK62_17400 [Alcanivorax sp. N3-2A]|nr:hypothetical protein CEK62_17400 [Alcanivorax sp. N3-2A]|tara:strand:+ start:22667 stop:25903 length:3237 start_codon:yes stop_codon:yes gene_type:complete
MRGRILIALAPLATLTTLVACGGGGSGSVSFDTPQYDREALYYSYPLDNQADIAPDAPVVLSFSDPISLSEDNFTIQDGDGNDVPFQLSEVNDGQGVVLRPTQPLKVVTEYQVTMNDVETDSGTVDFPDGTLNFTTRAAFKGPADLQKTDPDFKIASIFPDDDTQFKTLDFSSFRLRTSHPLADQTAVYGETVSLTHEGELVPAVLLAKGNAITVDPLVDMTPGDQYQLSVTGLTSRFGETIEDFERTVTPLDTKSPTGKRETLVTKVPPTDDTLGCLDPGVRLSELTGEPINCVPVIGTLLADQTSSKQSGNVFAELAFPPSFPDVTPLRVARGSILNGDALDVIIGGQVPVGFDSGAVKVQIISDASGYLFPNPNSDSPNAPKNLRLFMDAATTTADARANGAFTQNLLHLELVGTAIVRDGILTTDAVTVVEPRVLGVDDSYGVLSFRMESYLDQENAPQPPVDSQSPALLRFTGDNGPQLSWQPGDFTDRMVPGEPIVLLFDEALDTRSIVAGDSLRLTRAGVPEPFEWRLDGNALIITPDDPVDYGVAYDVTTTTGVTDLAGNPLMELDTLNGDNTLTFSLPEYVREADGESVVRGPFAVTVYPGFPCASSTATAGDISDGFQGSCVSSSPESEQVELDRLPIDPLPANRPIRVRFSQNIDPATLVLGESCDTGTVRVERVDANGACQGVVDGVLLREARALTFLPDQPWGQDALYRYTLASADTCDGTAICSEDNLPLQTALLEGPDKEDGGPDTQILFRGATGVDTVFQELNNLPSVDVNSNLQVDDGEPSVPSGTQDPQVPANATQIFTRGKGGEGLVTSANTGCGFDGAPPYTADDKIECDAEKLLYIAGSLNTELKDFDVENQGVPVVIYPTAVALTNLDATAVVGLDINTSDGDNSLETLPIIGGLLGGVVQTLGDILDIVGLEDVLLGQLGDLGLVPIPTSTGPNIMRIRYEPDGNGERTMPPVGYIVSTPQGPVFRITLNLLFDAPSLSLPLGLQHNVKSLPIDNLILEGPVDFQPDGRLFIGLVNQQALDVDLEITLAGLPGGKVLLTIPPGAINLSYQSPSIK